MQTESLGFMTDGGSTRSMHMSMLLESAEELRRAHMYFARGALKKFFPSTLSEMMQVKRKESYYAAMRN